MADLSPFSLEGRISVLIGGGGVIGSSLANGMADAGAGVIVCDLDEARAQQTADAIGRRAAAADARQIDALDRTSIQQVCDSIHAAYGQVDILVNLAGGNLPEASTSPEQTFFDIPLEAFERTVALNLFAGAILPAQVFGQSMVRNPNGGSIINIASMNALRPLTKIPAYSAAKSAVANFTQWLAVHFAQEYTPKLRVNAIAPGFLLTPQNHYLLVDPKSGDLTERARTIIGHTPMGRMGHANDLVGTVIWLASQASAFVTGIVVPVDGGFSAFGGV